MSSFYPPTCAPAAGNSRKTAPPSRLCVVRVLSVPRCCRRVAREQVETVPRRRADVLRYANARAVACRLSLRPRCCRRVAREQVETVPRRRADILRYANARAAACRLSLPGRCVQAQPASAFHDTTRRKFASRFQKACVLRCVSLIIL